MNKEFIYPSFYINDKGEYMTYILLGKYYHLQKMICPIDIFKQTMESNIKNCQNTSINIDSEYFKNYLLNKNIFLKHEN